jgi:hypothetical protein
LDQGGEVCRFVGAVEDGPHLVIPSYGEGSFRWLWVGFRWRIRQW